MHSAPAFTSRSQYAFSPVAPVSNIFLVFEVRNHLSTPHAHSAIILTQRSPNTIYGAMGLHPTMVYFIQWFAASSTQDRNSALFV